MVTCPTCGQENPEGFKFCGACGAPLGDVEPPPEEERKVITALFTDIVGSTASAEQLDPEDVHARLQPYYARLRRELEAYGGTVEKFIGDAVVAIFGAPVAHEDDPERAIRAALAITRAVAELNEEDAWLDLHIRTAVHTGEALVVVGARAVEGEGVAAGDVMNTAARLQGGAPVDGIAVGEATYRATAHAFDYREAEPVQAKGKAAPIPVWVLVGEKAAPRRPAVRAPLVGRNDELADLTALWSQTLEERTSRLVTVLGPAGIGKSRLLLALSDRAEQDGATLWGRCLPYGEGITYWPIAEIVQERATVKKSDDPATVSAKLEALLDSLPTDDLDELRTIAAALANLVGTPTTPRGTYEAIEISQGELHWGIRRVLQLLAQVEPLLVVLEDLHWAEPTLLELVLYLAEEPEGPLLIVGSARPELAESSPGFVLEGGRRHARTIDALSEEESQSLLRSLLGSEAMGRGVSKLLDAAAGNPLFLEETIRMLADSGVRLDRELEAVPVPESLQALIGSRLDGLANREKRVAQYASVAGQVFWAGAVNYLRDEHDGIGPSLQMLERRDFVHENRPSSVAGDEEFAFKHILIRDVAYDRLPKGRRAELHFRFVDWLRTITEAAEDDFAEVIAYHLEQSCLLARGVARSPIEPPVEAAAAALARAGEKAERRGGIREANRYYARALDLVDDRRSRAALDLRVRAAFTRNVLGEVKQAAEELASVADDALARDEPGTRGNALAMLGQIELRQGRVAVAREHLREVGEIARKTDDRLLQVKAIYRLAALLADFEGEFEPAIQDLRRGLAIAEEIGDRGLQIEGQLRLAFFLVNMGEFAAAETELQRCLRLAQETGSLRDDAQATYLLGLVRYYRGDVDGAKRLGAQARDWLERTGETYMGIQSVIGLAKYALAENDPEAAERWLQEAVPAALEGGGWLVVWVYRHLVEAYVRGGKVDDAAALVALATRDLPEEDPYAKAQLRLAEGAVALAHGDAAAAVSSYETAVTLLADQQLPPEVAEARIDFARALHRSGRAAEARAELRLARESFAAMGASGYVAGIDDLARELESEGAGVPGPLGG